jgi:AraC family transcriptional regulator, transcriptional activator FtrA
MSIAIWGFMNPSSGLQADPVSGRIAYMRKDPAKRPTVALLVDDGFSPLEFGVACEVFGFDRSTLGVPWYRLLICGSHPGPISSQVGYQVIAPHGLDDLRAADTVVVPPIDREEPIAGVVLDELRRAHKRGARMISLCTGAFLLAEAGLLDGRLATTHWGHTEEMRARFPGVRVDRDVLYVDEGDIMTSAGSAASMDLCLHVVRKDFGAEIANRVARSCVVPPHRDGGQAQFVLEPFTGVQPGDPFTDTLAWVQEHLDEPIGVEDLARRSAMSPRSFARRFAAATGTTPHRWLVRQRVLLAQRLLETTAMGVDEIATRCGVGTAANLRMHFNAVVRASPAAYRRTFRDYEAAG